MECEEDAAEDDREEVGDGGMVRRPSEARVLDILDIQKHPKTFKNIQTPLKAPHVHLIISEQTI